MSSIASSTKRPFRDALSERLMAPLNRALMRWVRRRGPVHPPLTLRYRQIYILPTGFGWIVGLLLFGMLLGSLNFNNNLGLLTTFLVAGTGLLSMHLAHRNLDGLRIVQVHAPRVHAGQPMKLSVELADTLGRARRGLKIECAGRETGAGLDLTPHGRGEIGVELASDRRGWVTLPRIRVVTRYPLGWFVSWSWFWPSERALVWPRLAESLPPLPTAASLGLRQAAGEDSDEFLGLRAWREGDALHRIAWKASQRHRQLLARQYSKPHRDRLWLRLSGAPGAGMEARIETLAGWVLEAERCELDYGLELPGVRIEPGHGRRHRHRCLDALAEA